MERYNQKQTKTSLPLYTCRRKKKEKEEEEAQGQIFWNKKRYIQMPIRQISQTN